MKLKNIVLFVCFCICINTVYAKDAKYPVDTVALQEALEMISADKYDAKSRFYLYFITYKADDIPVNKIVDKCLEFIKDNYECRKFIETYTSSLDHANFCLKANKEKITPNYNLPGKENQMEYTFQECTSIASGDKDRLPNGSERYTGYTGDSYLGKCVDWLKAAEKCQRYLIGYYQDKLNKSKLSKPDKKYYECLLDKVKTGNMDFPISKMEADCK